MKTHELKLDIKYFDDVKSGYKNFEIRKNDRDFQVGDTLRLIAIDSGKYVFKQGIGTIPIKKYKWKKCKKLDAETIKVKVLEIFGWDAVSEPDDNKTMFDGNTILEIKKVLNDYFSTDSLPYGYVVLGIEVLQ